MSCWVVGVHTVRKSVQPPSLPALPGCVHFFLFKWRQTAQNLMDKYKKHAYQPNLSCIVTLQQPQPITTTSCTFFIKSIVPPFHLLVSLTPSSPVLCRLLSVSILSCLLVLDPPTAPLTPFVFRRNVNGSHWEMLGVTMDFCCDITPLPEWSLEMRPCLGGSSGILDATSLYCLLTSCSGCSLFWLLGRLLDLYWGCHIVYSSYVANVWSCNSLISL